MIYKEDVLIFAKMYISKRGNRVGGKVSKLSRNELVEKIMQKGGYRRSEKNIKEIRKILNEEFNKTFSDKGFKIPSAKKIKKEQEEKIIQMYVSGEKTRDILEKFKIANSTLHTVLNRNNVPKRNKGRMKNETVIPKTDLSDEIVKRINRFIELENKSKGLKR